jgi:hypothetical protein
MQRETTTKSRGAAPQAEFRRARLAAELLQAAPLFARPKVDSRQLPF